MARLDAWVRTGSIEYDDGLHSPRAARAGVGDRRQDHRRHEGQAAADDDARRYVDGNDQRLLRSATACQGRLLRTQGRSGLDHRTGQAGEGHAHRRRARHSSNDNGVEFHYGDDFTEKATRGQLRGYCAALDFLEEFRADCIGWQYQLGLDPFVAAVGLRRRSAQLGVSAREQRQHGRLLHRSRPGQRAADGDAEAPAAGARTARIGRVPRRALGRRCTRGASSGCC